MVEVFYSNEAWSVRDAGELQDESGDTKDESEI
jgi:hypothetical protein